MNRLPESPRKMVAGLKLNRRNPRIAQANADTKCEHQGGGHEHRPHGLEEVSWMEIGMANRPASRQRHTGGKAQENCDSPQTGQRHRMQVTLVDGRRHPSARSREVTHEAREDE